MTRIHKLVLSIALATVSAPTLAKKAEAPLKREGAWVMEYADGACHLSAVRHVLQS